MNDILNKIFSLFLAFILVSPSFAFAAGEGDMSQKDIAKLITSSESPSDKGHGRELALSIMGAMFVTEELPNLYKLVETAEGRALKEFKAEYSKWYNLMPEYYRAEQLACKNAREQLIARYQKEIDYLWERRYNMSAAERESRVLIETKMFLMENITYIKGRGIVINTSLKNPELISRLSMDIMGKNYVEEISARIAKSIDISGPHAYMGYSVRNIRETVIGFLNDIVKTTYRAVNGSTHEKRLINAAKSENSVKLLAKTIALHDGQDAFMDFLRKLEYRLEKDPRLGIFAGAVIGIGFLFAASSNASAHNISNSRLAIARELKATLNATPSLLSTKVIALKNVYGTSLVSSIVYENRDAMLPLLKAQFALMKNPKVIAQTEILLNGIEGAPSFNAERDAAIKKAQIITAVQDNTYVKRFNEKMAPLRLK